MVEYKTGDLFEHMPETGIVYIAHVVNQAGRFGSGFAKQLAARYPEVVDMYRSDIGHMSLGSIFPTAVHREPKNRGRDLLVMHMVAMRDVYHSTRNPTPLHMRALHLCLRRLSHYTHRSVTIVMPMIGAGLARGNWPEINALIKQELGDHQGRCVVFSGDT